MQLMGESLPSALAMGTDLHSSVRRSASLVAT